MNEKLLQERYEIQEQLGKNPGRKTLLAKDLQTQELVVVKLLNFGDDFQWQDLKLFEREAEILQKLSHPAIPSYLDSFNIDSGNSNGVNISEVNSSGIKSFAIAQTYIPAKSLEEHVKSGRSFSETDVKQIAQSLLEVLVYLHRQQPSVVHRDIKPSNILLGEGSGNFVGEVYLVDFGSVKSNPVQARGTMTIVGTYGYMPPEQFSGKATPISDLYALGATLIYLLTKTHPADLLEDDIEIKFEEFVNLSPEFSNWLKWLVQPSRKRRPKSAKIALQELFNPTSHTRARHFNLYSPGNIPVSKPKGSKIKLKKNSEKIEIIIPQKGGVGYILLGVFATAWLLIIGTVTFLSYGLILLFILPLVFWAIGIVLMLTSLFGLFGYTRLLINQEEVSLTHELFCLKYYGPRPGKTQDICKIEITGRTIYKQTERNSEIPPKLIVWSGIRKYEIASVRTLTFSQFNQASPEYYQDSITSPELDWLASELSDWLEIPVSRE